MNTKIMKVQIKGSNGYNISAKMFLPFEHNKEIKEIIIACHGFAGDKESSVIVSLAEAMVPNNIGVICFDFPGHGESEVETQDKLSIENCIQDINDIEKYIRELYRNIPISIFATSFGAYLALINIAKNNKIYNHIILRAPAIKMLEIFKNTLLRESIEDYKERGYTKHGFEREMNIPYSFLQELEQNNLFKIYENVKMPKIYIIQGDKDDTAPIQDSKDFMSQHKDSVSLYIIPGADHRMKGPGELEKVIEYSKKIIIG